ncbi:MAG: MTAP family purine nucleoside phosphorylase [Sedimentisphaerales bacterium]|nr:MTAP family purine nucleoside phosphorylase [Sedimentisphaerales bacterium]
MTQERIGIIGGTGLGDALLEHITDIQRHEVDTPFGAPSTPVTIGTLGNRKIAFLARHGQGHTLHPGRVPYAANIFALKKLGVTTVLAGGAVGSLRDEIQPKQLVIVDQFIDKTFRRQNSFFDAMGAVHCEFDQPCCPRLQRTILEVASQTKNAIHENGTYVCMEGPQFSSRAESLMHQKWGGDVIGMTALPEAKLAREAQMCYALIALVSDYDAWRPHPAGKDKHDLLAEILGNLNEATANAIGLITAVLQSDHKLCSDTCSCRKSLEMAVWTNPDAVDKDQRNKLAPLFA